MSPRLAVAAGTRGAARSPSTVSPRAARASAGGTPTAREVGARGSQRRVVDTTASKRKRCFSPRGVWRLIRVSSALHGGGGHVRRHSLTINGVARASAASPWGARLKRKRQTPRGDKPAPRGEEKQHATRHVERTTLSLVGGRVDHAARPPTPSDEACDGGRTIRASYCLRAQPGLELGREN